MNIAIRRQPPQFLAGLMPPPALVIGLHVPLARRAAARRGRRASSCRTPSCASRPTTPSPSSASTSSSARGPTPASPPSSPTSSMPTGRRSASSPPRPTSSKYANSAFGVQGTGGSTAMANSWDQLRKAGAEARARLIAAAAEAWNVDAERDHHREGRRQARLRQDRQRSASLPKPRSSAAQRLRPSRRTRAPGATSASTCPRSTRCPRPTARRMYTIDVKLPDMLTCLVARPTRFAAKAQIVRSGPGARRARREGSRSPSRKASPFWPTAIGPRAKARDALKITWDETGTESRSTADLVERVRRRSRADRRARSPATTAMPSRRSRGAAKVIEATYTFPYLAHAPMEPNDCVIHRTARRRRRADVRLAAADRRPDASRRACSASSPSR